MAQNPTTPAALADARTAVQRALAGASRARARDTAAQLRNALSQWIGTSATGDEDVARLDAAYPILLLPVRLETRFVTTDKQQQLLVRIYPDEIAADTHEPELTDVELALGQQYWTAGWTSANEQTAWQTIIQSLTPQRAAWVVLATTPDNIADRPDSAPVFSTPSTHEGVWTRAARAHTVPDRWVVVCYRGGVEVARAVGLPVVDPLPLTLDPSIDVTDPADVIDLGGGLTINRDVLWTIDFDEAVAQGMAVRVTVPASAAASGFDRVIAVGVKGSLAPADAAERVTSLFDAQHYTRGVTLPRQGTPTNNSEADAADYPAPDPEGAASFVVERGAPLTVSGADGRRLADALGVDPATFDHIAGAARGEQSNARAMNGALWPSTWGYYLEQMLDSVVTAADVKVVESYFLDWVRGRGPLPLLSVGNVPYGVLPVSSLARWTATGGEQAGMDAILPPILRRLLPRWTAQADAVAHVGRSADPDQDLLDILARDASAREVWIRTVSGPAFQRNLRDYLNGDTSGLIAWQTQLRTSLVDVMTPAATTSRVLDLVFQDQSLQFRFPFVAPAPLSERDPLNFNYLQWLRTATIADIRAERMPSGVATPHALLYQMVRNAMLQRYHLGAVDLGIRGNIAVAADRLEPELVGIVAGTENQPTVWERIAAPVPSITGGTAAGDFLHAAAVQLVANPGTPLPTPIPEVEPIADFMMSIQALELLPTAELDRLFSETLDCCAYRLDAWISSLVTERLARLRARTPTGVHLGGFGWVENLQPAGAVGAAAGGFIHAPSMDHASAAAVLRNAYLTRSGADQARYAVDLSSERVRNARWVLASVREGQSIGALLGYQFERGLHEGQLPLHLDQFIEPLRLLYPIPEAADATSTDPAESLSPRDVVNGIALRDAWVAGSIPFGATADLSPSAAERAGIEAELAALNETIDAVADVLTADAVYHLVRGTTAGAAASLDSLAQGVRPPDPDITRVPRGGTDLTHRVAVILSGGLPATGWNAIPDTPRSAAEPWLDRWLGALLGDPANTRCRVSVPDPTIADPGRRRDVQVTLDQLAMHPLDLLSLLPVGGAGTPSATVVPHADDAAGKGAELDRRIAQVALAGAPQQGTIEINYQRDPTWGAEASSLGELMEVARAAAAVVGAARPFTPADLSTPDRASSSTAVMLDAEALTRATASVTALTASRAALDAAIAAIPAVGPGEPEPDLSALRLAMESASHFGIAGTYPALVEATLITAQALLSARLTALPPDATLLDLDTLRDALRRAAAVGIAVEPASVIDPASTDDQRAIVASANNALASFGSAIPDAARRAREALLSTAASTSVEMGRRAVTASALTDPLAIAQAVFGRGFSLIVRFQPGDPTELQAALDYGPTLAVDEDAKQGWLAQAERVRTPLARWRRLSLYAGCLGTAPPPFAVAQLPHVVPARWVALDFASEADRPLGGRLSLALMAAAVPAAVDPWGGLMIDEWTESIPATTEATGISFHYDDPGAEAAQTMLLAVPPTGAATWDMPTLMAILDETLTLAKVRAVDGELLGDLGQLLPAVFLAANPANDTVTTDLRAAIALPARLVFQA